MDYATAIAAATVGVLQMLLLQAITQRITKLKTGSVIIFLIAKVCLYAACIVLVLTLLRKQVIYAGIGYAIGFMATLIIILILNLAKERKRGEDNDKGNN